MSFSYVSPDSRSLQNFNIEKKPKEEVNTSQYQTRDLNKKEILKLNEVLKRKICFTENKFIYLNKLLSLVKSSFSEQQKDLNCDEKILNYLLKGTDVLYSLGLRTVRGNDIDIHIEAGKKFHTKKVYNIFIKIILKETKCKYQTVCDKIEVLKIDQHVTIFKLPNDVDIAVTSLNFNARHFNRSRSLEMNIFSNTLNFPSNNLSYKTADKEFERYETYEDFKKDLLFNTIGWSIEKLKVSREPFTTAISEMIDCVEFEDVFFEELFDELVTQIKKLGKSNFQNYIKKLIGKHFENHVDEKRSDLRLTFLLSIAFLAYQKYGQSEKNQLNLFAVMWPVLFQEIKVIKSSKNLDEEKIIYKLVESLSGETSNFQELYTKIHKSLAQYYFENNTKNTLKKYAFLRIDPNQSDLRVMIPNKTKENLDRGERPCLLILEIDFIATGIIYQNSIVSRFNFKERELSDKISKENFESKDIYSDLKILFNKNCDLFPFSVNTPIDYNRLLNHWNDFIQMWCEIDGSSTQNSSKLNAIAHILSFIYKINKEHDSVKSLVSSYFKVMSEIHNGIYDLEQIEETYQSLDGDSVDLLLSVIKSNSLKEYTEADANNLYLLMKYFPYSKFFKDNVDDVFEMCLDTCKKMNALENVRLMVKLSEMAVQTKRSLSALKFIISCDLLDEMKIDFNQQFFSMLVHYSFFTDKLSIEQKNKYFEKSLALLVILKNECCDKVDTSTDKQKNFFEWETLFILTFFHFNRESCKEITHLIEISEQIGGIKKICASVFNAISLMPVEGVLYYLSRVLKNLEKTSFLIDNSNNLFKYFLNSYIKNKMLENVNIQLLFINFATKTTKSIDALEFIISYDLDEICRISGESSNELCGSILRMLFSNFGIAGNKLTSEKSRLYFDLMKRIYNEKSEVFESWSIEEKNKFKSVCSIDLF